MIYLCRKVKLKIGEQYDYSPKMIRAKALTGVIPNYYNLNDLLL